MGKDKEFEMELLKRYIKDYKRTKTRKDKSEILSRYCKLTNISRRPLRRDFKGLKAYLTPEDIRMS